MLKIITGIAAIFGAIIAIVLPNLKRQNDKLNQEVKQKDSVINSVKENEKIKKKNSKLSNSELFNKL